MGQTKKEVSCYLFILLLLCLLFFLPEKVSSFVVPPSAAPLPDARPTGIWDRPKKAPGLISFLLFILLLVLFLPDQVSSFVVVPPYAARLIQAEYGPGQKSTQAILSFLQKL